MISVTDVHDNIINTVNSALHCCKTTVRTEVRGLARVTGTLFLDQVIAATMTHFTLSSINESLVVLIVSGW